MVLLVRFRMPRVRQEGPTRGVSDHALERTPPPVRDWLPTGKRILELCETMLSLGKEKSKLCEVGAGGGKIFLDF